MATYNGMPYIKTQIESIISQSYNNWRLLIHDDGSIDGTVELIRKYILIDNRICLLEDGVYGLGPGKNFMHILKYSESEFVCFSDQDDYWFENKLQIMYDTIFKYNNLKPQCCVFNAYTWFPDSNNYIGKCAIQFHPSNDFQDYILSNGGLQGSSMIFNLRLKEIIDRDHRVVYMHDYIVTFASLVNKCIHYHNIPLMLYRQHDKNFTGHISQSLKQLLLKEYNNHLPVIDKLFYESTKSLFEVYQNYINANDRKLFKSYFNLENYFIIKRIFSIIKYSYSLRGSKFLLILKVIKRPFIA